MKEFYKIIRLFIITILIASACKVTFITGYDEVIDSTSSKMKTEFNLHYLKMMRTLHDTDPYNQKFENFQDYYDQLVVDTMVLSDRILMMNTSKSFAVQSQVKNLDSLFAVFISWHQRGIKDAQNDMPFDDKRDVRNAINSSLNAIIKLQLELKEASKN